MMRAKHPIYSLEKSSSASWLSCGQFKFCVGSRSATAFRVFKIGRASHWGQLGDERLESMEGRISPAKIGERKAGPPAICEH